MELGIGTASPGVNSEAGPRVDADHLSRRSPPVRFRTPRHVAAGHCPTVGGRESPDEVEGTTMTSRRNRSAAVAIADNSGWAMARRVYCLLSVAMTGYFVFVAAWVMTHPIV